MSGNYEQNKHALIDVFIIDDDKDFRQMLVKFLVSKNISVHDFACPEQAIQNYVPTQVGCIVMDIKMNGMDGIELVKRLKVLDPLLPVITITGYSSIKDAISAIKNGAIDYIERPFDVSDLYTKIMACLTVTDTVRKQRILDSKMRINLDKLTFRERQVLTLLALGLSNKEIGLSLDISYRTVEVHRAHIMEKLKAHSIADLVRITHYIGM